MGSVEVDGIGDLRDELRKRGAGAVSFEGKTYFDDVERGMTEGQLRL